VSSVSRRVWVGAAALGAVGAAASIGCNKDARSKPPKEGDIPRQLTNVTPLSMPMRKLGKTGVVVSAVGIGGAHLGTQSDERESIVIIRSALDRGVTFLDNCWDYNGGKSEERMGKALRDGYRQKAFLMTKLDGRTKDVARRQLEQSLRRLQTDVIDLIQIHEVIRPDDPEQCFREGGCVEALIEAKKAGKVRFIGFTGHKDPAIHLAMLKAADAHSFAFDTVQMPLNVMDAHFRSFEKLVLPVAMSKGMGILGMKSMGAGIILETKAVTAVECLRYALSLPTSVVITGCDSMGVLDQAIDTTVGFKPYSDAEVAELLGRTRNLAKDGQFEKFKTSQRFDGTNQNPKWLTTAEI
jgi:aryl-alcohol dehydrogenase-like predicted oxidoreductase